LLGLHNHVIHISMHILPYLLLQTLLHGSLVGCSSILQAEGHGDVAVGSVRGYEGGLDLIRLVQQDLVVA
jgi:hypothetical protein